MGSQKPFELKKHTRKWFPDRVFTLKGNPTSERGMDKGHLGSRRVLNCSSPELSADQVPTLRHSFDPVTESWAKFHTSNMPGGVPDS